VREKDASPEVDSSVLNTSQSSQNKSKQLTFHLSILSLAIKTSSKEEEKTHSSSSSGEDDENEINALFPPLYPQGFFFLSFFKMQFFFFLRLKKIQGILTMNTCQRRLKKNTIPISRFLYCLIKSNQRVQGDNQESNIWENNVSILAQNGNDLMLPSLLLLLSSHIQRREELEKQLLLFRES